MCKYSTHKSAISPLSTALSCSSHIVLAINA